MRHFVSAATYRGALLEPMGKFGAYWRQCLEVVRRVPVWELQRPRDLAAMEQIMLHRHLSHQQFTLAAIDDVIARGKRRDWAELRRAAFSDRIMMEKVLQVCQAHVADPYAQRYHFWKQYVERYLA